MTGRPGPGVAPATGAERRLILKSKPPLPLEAAKMGLFRLSLVC